MQIPDERSRIPVRGVDIMLVLDASGSMDAIDDPDNPKKRLAIARDEAIKFVEKREHDPMGLVVFSGAAVSRVPLTLDKNILKQMLSETTVHTIPVEGTVLSKGILTAANRLKKSKAKSRIMIVLTDGAPSPTDIDPALAIAMAKKIGVKIYTIGIGSLEGGWVQQPLFGWVQVKDTYNEPLLKRFAKETGGRFFSARKPSDMQAIYKTIDKLERSEQEMPIYARYFEYFVPLLWLALCLIILEIALTTLVWVRL
jgi:Ca-activated chloride channel family protein